MTGWSSPAEEWSSRAPCPEPGLASINHERQSKQSRLATSHYQQLSITIDPSFSHCWSIVDPLWTSTTIKSINHDKSWFNHHEQVEQVSIMTNHCQQSWASRTSITQQQALIINIRGRCGAIPSTTWFRCSPWCWVSPPWSSRRGQRSSTSPGWTWRWGVGS